MRPVNSHTTAPQSASPSASIPAEDSVAPAAPAAPPDDADTLRLDLEFDFSHFRFRRILFSKISDPERATSLKTRLFGGVMASTARRWVKNYIRANIDVKNAGAPVQHILEQRRISGRDFMRMVQQTRQCGLNRDLGNSSQSTEPSFFDFTPRLSGPMSKQEEIALSKSRYLLQTIASAAQFDLLTPSLVQTIKDNIGAVESSQKDPSLIKQLQDLVDAAYQWRDNKDADEYGVPAGFDTALTQLEQVINVLSYELNKPSSAFDRIFSSLRNHCNAVSSKLGQPPLMATLLDEKFIAYCRTRDASLIVHPISADLLTIVHLKDQWPSMVGFLEKSDRIQLLRWIELLSEDVARSRRGQPLLRPKSESALNSLEARTGAQLAMKMSRIQVTEGMRPFGAIVSFVWDPVFHAYLESGTLDDMTRQDVQNLRKMAVQFDAEILDDFVSRGSRFLLEGGLSDKERQLLKTYCAQLRRLLEQ